MAPSNEEHPGPPYKPFNKLKKDEETTRTHIEPEYYSVFIRSLSVLDHEKI